MLPPPRAQRIMITPTMTLNQADLRKLLARFGDVADKQAPFAASLALNATGQDVLGENKILMDRVFDRPTRWTKNAFFLRYATKRNLVATVERKSAVGRRFYLEVQSDGGARRKTGIERLFSDNLPYEGHIEAIVPTGNLRRNAYGNVSPATMNRILSGVKVQRDKYQNTTAASRKRAGPGRAGYFVPRPGGKLSPGVFERKGSKIKKVLAFSQASPRYRAIYPMERHGREVALRVLPGNMRAAWKRAMSTAK